MRGRFRPIFPSRKRINAEVRVPPRTDAPRVRNGTRQAHVFPAPSRASAGGLLSRARGRALGWAICALAVAAGPAQAASGDISTVAGNGVSGTGGDGGPASSAQFIAPAGVGFSGSDLYISDFDGHTVRRVDSGGGIARVAGTGTAGYSGDGGAATSAQLDQPSDVVADAAGNVYIADFLNSRIRKVTPGGTISSYAGTGVYGYSGDGGPAFAAQLGNPAGLDIDAAGNLYVADFNSTVRKITPGGYIGTALEPRRRGSGLQRQPLHSRVRQQRGAQGRRREDHARGRHRGGRL